jgi:integrase
LNGLAARRFPCPDGRPLVEQREWRDKHHWHPHQLRHLAGTVIRKEFGLEAARIALVHSSAVVTDAVYAERDLEKVTMIMKEIG